MSTFLVCLGVVSATITGVLYLVLNAPDQPATIRRQPARDSSRLRRRSGAKGQQAEGTAVSSGRGPTMTLPATAGLAMPESEIMRLRVLPAAATTLWVRIRSSIVLVVLVGLLGALLALAVGGLALGLALLIRSATG